MRGRKQYLCLIFREIIEKYYDVDIGVQKMLYIIILK